MLPIIDTHQHLWDLGRFNLPWLAPSTPSAPGYPQLARNFSPADYADAIAGLNVVKSIYVEVDVEPSQQVAEAEYAVELCRGGGPTFAAIIAGDPGSDQFAGYVKRFAPNPRVKGVRRVLHVSATPPQTCLDDRFVRGVRLLGDHDLTFDLCMRPTELRDAAELIGRCPGTRFVVDHCGNVNVAARDYTQWQRDIERVARSANVVCKVSGIIESAPANAWTADDLVPIVDHVLEVFGPDRVLFASNWPVCTLNGTLRQWVEALRIIVSNRPEALRRNLFHDNAARLYGL